MKAKKEILDVIFNGKSANVKHVCSMIGLVTKQMCSLIGFIALLVYMTVMGLKPSLNTLASLGGVFTVCILFMKNYKKIKKLF